MRRFTSIALAILLISLCIIPCQAASINTISEDDYIYVDYEDFHSNRAYYNSLILQGYPVCVYIGDEYADEEIARFTEGTNVQHNLFSSMQTRGTSLPTQDYDVHANLHYHFTCDAKYETLYTNYKFYGCTIYLIDGFNLDYNNNLRVRVYGTSDGTIDFSIPPRSTLYKVITTTSSEARFYPAFYAPSNAFGSIYCVGH